MRAPAPILYFGTCLLVYAIARHLYDETVGFYAALSTALTPGVIFSARIISTDVPLLFFWALALLAYAKLIDGGDRRWSAVLGVAIGLGMLAKYAMIYFLIGAALAAWLERDARLLLRRSDVWLALALAALIILPNIHWNLTHELATFRQHTEASLRRLGVDALDLQQLHCVPPEQLRRGDVFHWLQTLHKEGKIKRWGASGRGRSGKGWVGAASSPGTELPGTGRSSTGKIGAPVSRCKRNK